MQSKFEEIYIYLSDEALDTWRPTQGIKLFDNIFRVLPTDDYDPEDEEWEFLPGSIVLCQLEKKNVDGRNKKIQIATKKIDTETIYVQLFDEGVDTWRPTQGVKIEDNIYRILPTDDYDPEDEVWVFLPGAIVICELEKKRGAKGFEEVLVAKSKVEDPSKSSSSST